VSTGAVTVSTRTADLSTYLIAGAVSAQLRDRKFDTEFRTVAEGMQDGVRQPLFLAFGAVGLGTGPFNVWMARRYPAYVRPTEALSSTIVPAST
jgi:hypothetical protein